MLCGTPAEIFDHLECTSLRQLFVFFLLENQLRYLINHLSTHFVLI